MWDAISFRIIHALMATENSLEHSYDKVQEYRKERWQKALAQAKGNKKKAYQLIVSEDFI